MCIRRSGGRRGSSALVLRRSASRSLPSRVTELLRWEAARVALLARPRSNKAFGSLPSISCPALLCPLLLACRGGEGEGGCSRGGCGLSLRWGFFSVPARRRGAGRSPSSPAAVPPWWWSAELVREVSSLVNMRCYDSSWREDVRPIRSRLAMEARGMDGTVQCVVRWFRSWPAKAARGRSYGTTPSASAWWFLGSMETTTMAAVCKRRFQANILPGHAIGSAAPEFQSVIHTSDRLRIAIQAVYAVFMPLGCVRRRRMRSSPKLLPRFSGEDPVLSSVMHPPNPRLNLLPRLPLPIRLLVEPLALRLERLVEALEEHSCRFTSSLISTNPLAGSDGVLLTVCSSSSCYFPC